MSSWPWPHDDNASLIAFYGDPRKPGWAAQNLVLVNPPFAITYEGKTCRGIQIHRKCASALTAALNEIWQRCGRNQAKADATGITKFSGSYNPRPVRGSTTKMSTHHFGAGVDFDSANNPLGARKGKMPQICVNAFNNVKAFWGGWFHKRGDWMHFQFAHEGAGYPDGYGKTAPMKMAALESIDPSDAIPDDHEEEQFDESAPGAPGIQVASADANFVPDFSAESAQVVSQDSASSDDQVKFVQQRLRDLGYFETGNVDGKLEDRTKGAISTFRGENGLPLTKDIDDQLLAALGKAKPRSIPESRANATEAEVAAKVEPVKQSVSQKLLAWIFGIPAAIGTFISAIGDYFKKSFADLQEYRMMFWDIPGYVWFGLAALLAVIIWWQANKAAKSGTKMYQEGRVL